MRWVALLALGIALNADSDLPDARVVQLDVAVSDGRGRAMPALRPEDFTVTAEDGAPLPVVAVRFVAGPAPARDGATAFPPIQSREAERAAAAEPGTRVFAFFLDEYHVDTADAPYVREAIGALIREQTAPGDLLLVVKPLDPLLSLRLTRDRAAALDAVASFEGRRGDYRPRNAFERDFIAGDPRRIDAVRDQLAVSALHAMATHLSGLREVRKALIVVSAGFAPATRRRGDVLPTVDAVVRAANRANVSIYAIDPAALTPGSPPAAPSADAADASVLRRLADETNGRLVAPGARLREVLERMASDLSDYYLLTLEGAADGRFHPIAVRVARPQAQVRTRRGYWAVSSDEIARAKLAAAPPPAAVPALPPVRVSRLIRPWFGQARGDDGRTRVLFVWEAAAAGAGERSRGLPPSRLVLRALAPDGSPLFEGVVNPSGDGGPASRAAFDAPPGRLRMQMSIEDAALRVLDTDVRDLVVGSLSEAVAFGTPAVFRARTARAFKALATDAGATPVASREFSRLERLLIRAPLYAPDDADVAVTATLTNRLGQTMRTLAAIRPADSNLYAVDLPLAGLAAGEYAVLLRAAGGPGDARETVAFRVTP